AYIGNKITAVYMYTPSNGSGVNPIKKGIAFVTDDLSKLPEFSINDIPSEGSVEARLKLDNPVEITGEKTLYFGFRFLYDTSCGYVTCDGKVTNARTALVGAATKANVVPQYSNVANQVGNLCMSIEIAGTNLPQDNAMISGIDVKDFYAPGEFGYPMKFRNLGSKSISNLSVQTTYAGYTTTSEINLAEELAPAETGEVTIGPLPALEGVSVLTAKIVKVNGVEIESKPVSKPYSSYTSTIARRLVIEEGTGTWCQYCPLGILMMEYLKEKYPDWIRIAVHNGDRMELSQYQAIIQEMGGTLPSAITNRAVTTQPQWVPNYAFYDEVYKEVSAVPAYVNISTEAEATADQVVNVTVKTNFLTNSDATHGICVVTVEDGVGPYTQQNGIAGAGPEYGIWGTTKELSLSTIYEDVARNINKYPADSSAYSGNINKGEEYTYTTSMSVKNIKAHEFKLVAMVVNMETGEIANAEQIIVDNTAGVSNIYDDSSEAAYYTLDGRKVNANTLSGGIYIEKKGGKTRKIMVK
ncbi:MAG: hypothetical protein K2M87_03285, partial [Muribaculaceae bacterium]|nr:hypothetical protein [Muribaculaceae bacterium]